MSDDEKYSKLSKEEKDELDKLLKRLDEKEGRWSNKRLRDLYKKMYGDECHYCRIPENKIAKVWKPIYSKRKGKEIISTRKGLELEHKDGDKTNNSWKNLSLACPICNIAKSDQFNEEQFTRVGKVIRKIWGEIEERKQKKLAR
jgi:5-methylcytosine-specific restriction endonuclease McrA